MPWCSKSIEYLQCQHPLWTLIRVWLFYSWFNNIGLEKRQRMVEVPGLLHPCTRHRRSSWFMVLAWPSLSHWGLLQSEPLDERSLCLSLFLYLWLSNKSIFKKRMHYLFLCAKKITRTHEIILIMYVLMWKWSRRGWERNLLSLFNIWYSLVL